MYRRVDKRVLRNRALRTGSGGEPSSIKQNDRCAARVPVLSVICGGARRGLFDSGVYGLVFRLVQQRDLYMPIMFFDDIFTLWRGE